MLLALLRAGSWVPRNRLRLLCVPLHEQLRLSCVCRPCLLPGNTMIMGTVSYPDETGYALASRRGVISTTQHFTLLGMNT